MRQSHGWSRRSGSFPAPRSARFSVHGGVRHCRSVHYSDGEGCRRQIECIPVNAGRDKASFVPGTDMGSRHREWPSHAIRRHDTARNAVCNVSIVGVVTVSVLLFRSLGETRLVNVSSAVAATASSIVSEASAMGHTRERRRSAGLCRTSPRVMVLPFQSDRITCSHDKPEHTGPSGEMVRWPPEAKRRVPSSGMLSFP